MKRTKVIKYFKVYTHIWKYRLLTKYGHKRRIEVKQNRSLTPNYLTAPKIVVCMCGVMEKHGLQRIQ